MAPEQLEGKDADHRTDIFAFGAVVYEMATGQRAFTGDSQASLIGAILKDEPPPMSSLQTMTPPALDYVVKTCLAKDPDSRWQGAGDVGRQVRGIVESGSQPGMAALIPAESGRRGWHRAVPWLYGLVVGALAAWVFISLIPSSPVSVTRTTIRLAAGHQLDLGRGYRDVAISPDGTRVVYAAQSDAANLLFVRRLDQSDVVPLTRSESRNPFISPDGTTVGYFTGAFPSLLRRVSIQGGGPSTMICEISGFGRGASWGPDGTIIFATARETAGSQRSSGSGGLWRVHAEGGDAEQLTSPVAAAGELDRRWPEILPGGRDVLFTITGSTSQESKIALLALDTLDYTVLIRGGTDARYSPTGHLVYGAEGTLLAVPFDLSNRQTIGEPIPVLPGVNTKSSGAANFDFSQDGSLVYVTGGATVRRTLGWVDPSSGNRTTVVESETLVGMPRLSPDGERVAVVETDEHGVDAIWIRELDRPAGRVKLSMGEGRRPAWRDTVTVSFDSNRSGTRSLYARPTDFSNEDRPILEGPENALEVTWSADGRTAVYVCTDCGSAPAIWLLVGDGTSSRFETAGEFEESAPQVSPDGRWLAYVSKSGPSDVPDVFVQPFPNGGRVRSISTSGGVQPLWSRDGAELYYRRGRQMLAVKVEADPEFRASPPEVLFEDVFEGGLFSSALPNYDVSSEGQFMMLWRSGTDRIELVQNWHQELLERVPVP